MSKVYMMVTITNRNKRKDFQTFFKEYGLPVFLETIGRGTAQSEVLDYFGLEESEKLLFLAIVTGETWKKLRRGLITKMLIDVPGTGVSFIVPLSSVGGRKTLQFLVNEQEFEKEEETSMKDTDYELLVAIANQGYIDTVMDAARAAKAGGGTVIHAKGTGMELAKKYLGSSKKYKLIYNANKKLIDARNKKERKKHPKKKISKYTIYKGQVLVIPVPSSKSVSNSKVTELKKAMNKDGYSKLKVDKKLTSAMKSAMKKIKIRRGRRGKVVKFVQKIVRTKQDGIYGSKTAAAVKRYQRKHKLTVDGVVGYKTLLKMIGG